MKFSESWLREWVNPSVSTKELVNQLTMAGLEVESVEPVAPAFSGVVIGEVQTVKHHPQADRLHICEVNTGREILTIVCGAANVRPQLKVAVANIGAVLPGNFNIKTAKIRGQDSKGMICSQKELGLGSSSYEGIWELADDAPLGENFWDYLCLSDHTIEVNLTPNRGDCASILGIAREVAALSGERMHEPAGQPITSIHQFQAKIALQAEQYCPKYLGIVVKHINPQVKTPTWLSERLRRSGIGLVHPIVDITNYVMLELGTPMHAFNLDKLEGDITVRLSHSKEKLTLLDGQEIELQPDTLLIADTVKPLALAGVMGGLASAIHSTTTNIFLESAFFQPEAILKSGRHYKLSTDSSYRFERGVDPTRQQAAIERAVHLVLQIAGGEVGPLTMVESKSHLPEKRIIKLRHARIKRVLGIELTQQQVMDILSRLGMRVSETTEGWEVGIPSYRFDIHLEIDLIEELARLHNYDQIPLQPSKVVLAPHSQPEDLLSVNRLRDMLVDRGYHEAVTYSFVDPKVQQLIDPQKSALVLSNPISADHSVMRLSLWPGLLSTLQYNQNRQQERLRLFEIGMCFILSGNELLQVNRLAGVLCGGALPEQWSTAKRQADFFDCKGDIESLLNLTREEFDFTPFQHPALHPGKSAAIYRHGKQIGQMGELHPRVKQKLNLTGDIFLFELDLETLRKTSLPIFQPISKFPLVRRDIAIVVDEKILIKEITTKITSCSKKLLKNIQLFDIYKGDGIEPGKKSVALALFFQDQERTLVDMEVDQSVATILQALQKELNATLRT